MMGVAGNGLCEVGERCDARVETTEAAGGTCVPEDCPIPINFCPEGNRTLNDGKRSALGAHAVGRPVPCAIR